MLRIFFRFVILIYLVNNGYLNAQHLKCNLSDTSKCSIYEKYKRPQIKLEKKWESERNTHTFQVTVLADIDNDCVPEFIVRNDFVGKLGIPDTSKIVIVSGVNGKVKYDFNCLYYSDQMTMALADIDNDGFSEIIMGSASWLLPNGGKLVCYDLLGNVKWISSDTYYFNTSNNPGEPSINIADFNQDGIPEVYCNNRIFNARTGALLIEGTSNNGFGGNYTIPNGWETHTVSIAAQLDKDTSDLELAAGFTIYKVKIVNLNGQVGNSMIPYNVRVDKKLLDGRTAVADINKDGQLDVIVSHSDFDVNSRIYVYTMSNGIPTLLAKNYIPGLSEINGCPSIADIDNNGKPNILVSKNNYIHNFEFDGINSLNLIWSFIVRDTISNSGIITFDLDANGISEIIYRGDSLLYIIDGSANPPILIDSKICLAVTLNENCIVADIDNTGQSKICTVCGSNLFNNSFGKLTVYGSPTNQPPWAPARPIWNQYAYNPLFINDDLTVPQFQKN
ncbi:MAG: VCBS repeat-containing protein, partial [Saprospiraceae bacterium]